MFNQYFGNYLLEKNILKPEELRPALEEQKSVRVKLGVLAIDSGYMNAAQVEAIHKLQASRDRKFGELAIEEGYLTGAQLDELLNMQKKSNILLGQVLIELGFFTFEKYEEVLLQYRQDSKLTSDEIQALKNNDVKKISDIFLKTLSGEHDRIAHEYFELFIRNLVRFIDDEIRLEEAAERESYSFRYLVTQKLEGEYGFFSGFAASDSVMARFASIYAEEDLDVVNDLAEDSVKEFLNCHNGLFLSHMAHKGIELELLPAEVLKDGSMKPGGKLYVIPCNLNFGRIDFIFSDEMPDFN
jgi:hypothetical protein